MIITIVLGEIFLSMLHFRSLTFFDSVLAIDHLGIIYSASIIPYGVLIALAILVIDPNKTMLNIVRGFSSARSQTLNVVAFDQGRNASRVYETSRFAYYSDLKKYPLAGIHSNARALPGDSGGAVVDQNGHTDRYLSIW